MDTLTEQYLTVGEAADVLRVHQSTIRRWIAEGRLPAARIGQRRLALRRADVASLVTPVVSATDMRGRPIESSLIRGKMTPEQQQAREAVEASRQLLAAQRRRRGGVPFPNSWEEINEEREKRGQYHSPGE